ncbi:hypothetical protein LHK_01631 [Laribacter hongkongensis HLHK9]|uniref:DUF4376 domain-containing protein n=1 Tax=Laribacter hongkongensis (strain HLHK9) TaxID=557598 RepID=C1D827_LARHH|nr:hypothetical protein LHK_01631 [Laribacter hongkongensis HLHK9]
MYQQIKGGNGVIRLHDGAVIPATDGNRDWQAYQDWVAAGNAPLPADVSTNDALRDRALEQFPAWEKAERAAGIEHAGRRWLTTTAALQDIRDVLLAGAVPGEQWVTADRQIVPMTFAGLQSLWQAITARGAQIYQRRLEMEQQIADMSREQLEAFVPGWPASSQEAVA